MSLRAAMELFDAVVDLSAEERVERLRQADAAVVTLVQDMLRADATSQRFATGVAGDWLAADLAQDPSLDAEPPDLAGYRIHRLLGRGGMGRVYEASQLTPSRPVALKILHPWLLSDRSRAWLHDEAEALGAVLHPGIPQVYALEEADGHVFLAMELVEGTSLLQAAADLDTRARVRLGVQVGEAVSHAHSRGLLHLDLKPDNVLVTAEGRAKVLDFGISRTLDSDMDGAPIAGTPGYMPPEQQRGERLDARTDVFAFGRLLGALLRRDGSDSSGGTGHNDLDAVIARATASAPQDRTASVEAMVGDLRAWLEHRPVSARPASPARRAALTVRRNPLAFSAGAAVLLILAGATLVSVDRARRADEARVQAEQARVQAEQAEQAAQVQARRAQDSAEFLTEVFLLLNPHANTGQRTLLDATLTALQRLDEGALADAPREAAHVRNAIAEALWNLDRRDEAEVQVLKAVAAYDAPGIEPDGTLVDALHSAAMVTRMGRRKPERREAEEMDKAWAYLDRAEAVSRALGEESRTAEILHSRGVWLHTTGDFKAAATALTEAHTHKQALVEHGEIKPDRLTTTLDQLSYVRMMMGDFAGAEAVLEQAMVLAQAAADGPDPRVATVLQWQADLAVLRGEPEQGLRLLDQVTTLRDTLGQPMQAALRDAELATRGRALADLGRWQQAKTVMQHYIQVELGGDASRLERETAWTLARAHLGLGEPDQARAVIEQALALDQDRPEGTGAWAWFYTLRARWRARLGEPGAQDDIRTALSVWEPRFTAAGPRAAELIALRGTLNRR